MTEALKVVERFYTLQGEGWWSGRPTIFVRFVGCNADCSYCDSRYASHPEEGVGGYETYCGRKGAEELAHVVRCMMRDHHCTSICLTGGEPTIQPAGLMSVFLREFGKLDSMGVTTRFAMETNGIIRPSWLELVDWITVSPKEADPESCFRDFSYAQEVKVVLAPEQEIPNFLGELPKLKFIMPMTKQPFAVNLVHNMQSYAWSAKKVLESGGWRLTGRLQEIAKIC